MSPEPNKKMEELLKQYAEQRKAAARSDFELHPATRKLLQGEVARTFEKTDDVKMRSSIFMLWPRIAIVCAFTALLAVTVMVLNTPNEQRVEVSQKSAQESAAPMHPEVQEPPKILSDASADRTTLQKREIVARSPAPLAKPLAGESKIANRGGVAAFGANSKSRLSESTNQLTPSEKRIEPLFDSNLPRKDFPKETFARVREEDAALKSESATLSTNSTSAPAAAAAQLLADAESPTRWQFVQQDLRAKYRQNLLSPAQPKILQSFELARDGNKISVIDGDGSIYEGAILSVAQDKVTGKEASKTIEENSHFAFRALGMNQQINQLVTFTGQAAFGNNQLNLNEETLSRVSGTLQLDESKKQTNAEIGGLIQGKVSIGGTSAFEIQATEVQK